ncbi:MAG TPA: YfhO family protein [Anaeromyxobacter sp.]|nr:YfhO family protein [Anaeromyxobacter sp.]
MHAPTKRWIAEELARGRLPEWNPYAGMGMPVVANAIDAPLHPFNLLLVALSPAGGLKAWILLCVGLAAVGALVWARMLGRTATASAIAALAFSISGPFVSSTDNVTYLTAYASLPWVFAAAHFHVRRGGSVGLALVGAASALSAASGDPQGWAFAVALLPAYAAIVAEPGARKGAVLRGIAASASAIVAAAPFMVPVALWLPHSYRAAGLDAALRDTWNLHPLRLVEFVVPGLFRHEPGELNPLAFGAYAGNASTQLPWFRSIYVGASVIALIVLGIVRDRSARWLVALAVAFGWASLGPYAGFGQITSHVPILDGFRYWEKLTVWVAMLGAILAATGADALLTGDGARPFSRAAAIAAALALGTAAIAAASPRFVAAVSGGSSPAAEALAANCTRGALHVAVALAVLAALIAAVARHKLPTHAAAAALVALVALDLGAANRDAYVLGPLEREAQPPLASGLRPDQDRVVTPFPSVLNRWPEFGPVGSMWEWGRRTLAVAWNVGFRIGSMNDYAPLREARWARVQQEVVRRKLEASMSLFGFGHMVVPLDPGNAVLAGVRMPFNVSGRDPELPAFLVEIPHRPRGYVAQRVETVDEAAALAFAVTGGIPGLSVIEEEVRADRGPPVSDVRIVQDVPGDTEFDVRLDAPGLFVVNDLYAPGWVATVDGEPTRVVRTNCVARGVWLEAGAHRVRFRYRTPGLVAGVVIALAGAVALGAWSLLQDVRGRWRG